MASPTPHTPRKTPRQWWRSLTDVQKTKVCLRIIAVCTGIAVTVAVFVLGLLIGGMTPTPTVDTDTDSSVSALRCPPDAMHCEASWTRSIDTDAESYVPVPNALSFH